MKFEDFAKAETKFMEIESKADEAFSHGQDMDSWIDATKLKVMEDQFQFWIE